MIKFTAITIKNFLSYGNVPTMVVLDRPGTTLVVGEDLDNTSSGTGANGVGKAQPLDALIRTPRGWIEMGDISIGDVISTPAGGTTTVIGVYPQGEKDIYKVTFADGRIAEACGEHLWKVQSHRWREGYKSNASRVLSTTEIKDLVEYANEKQKAWYNITIPTITPHDIPNVELPIAPYLLGALLGDGCIVRRQVRFSTSDDWIKHQVNGLLEGGHDQQLVQHRGDKQYDWGVRNVDSQRWTNNIADRLEELSLLGMKSHSKFIPAQYLEASPLQKIELLAGLMDTDGTVEKNGNINFSTSSYQLAMDVQYVVRSLGGKAKISEVVPAYVYNGQRKVGKPNFRVSIQYHDPHSLFTLERKLSRISESGGQYKNAGLRITDISFSRRAEAQCIMVDDPEHLYITNDFVVTHNTVLLNALVYGVYDKPVSDISKDNLVNNINKKNMEVTVEFEKDGKAYRIVRARKTKAGAAGNHVHFYENNKDITPDSVSNTNSLIEEIVGIPYDLFVRIVAFSATHIPFLDLPVRSPSAANQTDIIEELFDLKTLSEKASILKEHIKETEQSLKLHKATTDQLQSEHHRYEKQMQSAEQRVLNWQQENRDAIASIEAKLAKIADVDFDKETKLHDELADVDQQLKDAIDWYQKTEGNIHELQSKHGKVYEELQHLRDAKCPYCLQKYEDADAKIAENEAKLAEYESALSSEDEMRFKAEADVEGKAAQHKKIKKKITVKNMKELIDIRSKQDQYAAQLEELRNATNPFIEPLEELQGVELEEIDMSKINELTDMIDHQKFLLKLLTKKDSFVRKALLNKNIPFLNQRLQHYLTELGLSHTVEFTHEMTASISQFGRPLDFGNLSNGQRARVNIALSFAFRDVLQSIHGIINVCMLDEVLDVGLDAIGVQAAAKMLKRKARDEKLSMFVISHRDEIDSVFDHRLIVQMSKGFSYIKFED